MTVFQQGSHAATCNTEQDGLFPADANPAEKPNRAAASAPAGSGELAHGDQVTITQTIVSTGTITSIQYAGCSHGTISRRGGVSIPSTTHGSEPCPDRNTITGVMLVEKIGDAFRRSWIYLRVPGRTVTIDRLGGAR